MKILGFLLLLSGWAIVLAAIILLRPGAPRASSCSPVWEWK